MRAVAEQARARDHARCCRARTRSWVGDELARRFGLPRWQFALTATDANRFAIRLARHDHRPAEGARLQLVLPRHRRRDASRRSTSGGRVVAREGNVGPPVPLDETTRVVECNDVEALERELAHGDVACVLAEPALTNIGIVPPGARLPRRAARGDARAPARCSIIDETHTLCAGPGGYTRRARPRARRAHDRQVDRRRRRRAAALRLQRRGRDADRRARSRDDESRRRRHRRHARRRTCSRSPRCARRSPRC